MGLVYHRETARGFVADLVAARPSFGSWALDFEDTRHDLHERERARKSYRIIARALLMVGPLELLNEEYVSLGFDYRAGYWWWGPMGGSYIK
jgi:hypothetical protein